MDTLPKKRAPKRRSYPGDFLTRPYPNGNFNIQFRVPEHLRGIPPFGSKLVFKKSLGTKDRKLALAEKDRFLEQVGFYEPARERDRARVEANMRPADHYFEALNSVDSSVGQDSLIELAGELQGQLMEPDLSSGLRSKLEAQKAAIWKLIDSAGNQDDEPHAYNVTLGEAVSRLVSEMQRTGKKPKTLSKVQTAFNRFKIYRGRDDDLPGIPKSRVRAYWISLQSKGLAKGTIATDLGFLGSAFQLAADEGFISPAVPNPFRDHRLVGFDDPTSRRVFSPQELKAVMRKLADSGDLDAVAATIVGYHSGMRISEVFSAKLVKKDGYDGWSVESGKTRAAARFIPIQSRQRALLEILSYWPKLDQRLPLKTKTADALGKRFGRYKRVALTEMNVKDESTLVFHSLRHGFVTALFTAGYNEIEIADLTGHEKSSAKTEAARSYSQVQALAKLVEMTNQIPPLPDWN